MFCPVGYVTIAELWNEFSQKHRATLIQFILDEAQTGRLTIAEVYGSPDDYCEDVFLASFKSFSASVADTNGQVANLLIEVDQGHSNIFTKMSAIESYFVAMDPTEAGEDGYWLHKMGSNNFVKIDPLDSKAWNEGIWERKYPKGNNFAAASYAYHTLPFAFERGRYIIPDTLPPWHIDVMDEHYLSKIVETFGGRSLCLSEEDADVWRGRVLKDSTFIHKVKGEKLKMGRPSKIESALRDFNIVFPNGREDAGWKTVLSEIEKVTGNNYSDRTIRRALQLQKIILKG
ncbi:hypothetical protein BFP76_11180 [Amylibacter kogurei]|uniref:Uncharacterized protein n=1 Tax=Paramylibacter kogurei TaxID=1889778 RepID=A0A2G5KAB0_9RHOB|nr:hypothetical protein [Amylibacter kogurei]PIB26471.1 hypothetical protein BFP76_11180 [Amylibacter kogurei]